MAFAWLLSSKMGATFSIFCGFFEKAAMEITVFGERFFKTSPGNKA